MSLSTAVHAEPCTPEITTYTTSATLLIQIAAVADTLPYDVSETMSPSPLSCSTRYGTMATTLTSETTMPSDSLPYLLTKKSACDTSACSFA